MIIQSTQVWISEQFIPAQLEISGGKVWSILPYGERACNQDYGNHSILPGFIDIHCHGGFGYDSNDAQKSGLKKWANELPKEGVTGFVPTTTTDETGKLYKALHNISETMRKQDNGATILGIHLEGPFINEKYAGSHPTEFILEPDISQFREFQRNAEDQIILVTIAPEKDVNHALIRYCAHNHVLSSIGHSDASYEEVIKAYANGASSITHTFNAQSGVHHRKNGVAGAALLMDEIYSEIICDRHHISKEMIQLFFRCKGKDRGIMITDSIRAKGSPVGERFLFANQACIIDKDGSARVARSKRLAGSTLKMNEGLAYIIADVGVPIVSAINACTINPAKLLGMDDHIGKIQSGYDADLTILDTQFQVIQTYCKGKEQL